MFFHRVTVSLCRFSFQVTECCLLQTIIVHSTGSIVWEKRWKKKNNQIYLWNVVQNEHKLIIKENVSVNLKL